MTPKPLIYECFTDTFIIFFIELLLWIYLLNKDHDKHTMASIMSTLLLTSRAEMNDYVLGMYRNECQPVVLCYIIDLCKNSIRIDHVISYYFTLNTMSYCIILHHNVHNISGIMCWSIARLIQYNFTSCNLDFTFKKLKVFEPGILLLPEKLRWEWNTPSGKSEHPSKPCGLMSSTFNLCFVRRNHRITPEINILHWLDILLKHLYLRIISKCN